MKHSSAPLLLSLLVLAPAASASPQGGAVGLSRARTTFQRADTSKDGKLDTAEAARAGIPSGDLRKLDHDQDGSLSGDEFIVYYRQLLSRAGRKAAKDLEDEAARILAARKQAQDKRRERAQDARGGRPGAQPPQGKPADGPAPAEAPGSSDEEVKLLQRAVAAGRITAGEARDVLGLLQSSSSDAATLRDLHTSARARIEALQASGKVSPEEGRKLMNSIRARLVRAGVQPAPVPSPEAAADPSLEVLRRAVSVGRISPEEAREVQQLLEEKGSQPERLRTLHQGARARIEAMAQRGQISAEDGRTLMKSIDARLTRAGVKPASNEPAPAPAEAPALDPNVALLRRAVASGRVQPAEAREVLDLLESKDNEPNRLRNMHRKARARIQAMITAGQIDAGQGRQLMGGIATRLRSVGVTPAPAGGDVPPTPVTKEDANVALIRRAVEAGRVQASEAREVLDLLQGTTKDAAELRLLHRKARARIQAMAQAGVIDAKGGRSLMEAINARLASAGVTPDPVPAERGDSKQGGDQPAPKPAARGEGRPKPAARGGADGRGASRPKQGGGRPQARPAQKPKPVQRPANGAGRGDGQSL